MLKLNLDQPLSALTTSYQLFCDYLAQVFHFNALLWSKYWMNNVMNID